MAYAKVTVARVTGGTQLVSSQLSPLPAVKSGIVSPDYPFSMLLPSETYMLRVIYSLSLMFLHF